MATKAVAIDVGATTVRVAEMELKGGADPRQGATLTAYAERPVPAGVLRDGHVEEAGTFAQTVKETLSAAKVRGKKVIISVGHPSVVVREVDVPEQEMSKLRESLAFHVQEDLPMSVDEAQLDFYPTIPIESPQGPMLRGLLVASPRELVRGLVKGLEGAGVDIARVDHKALGLWRSGCQGQLMQKNVAFVDMGARTTTIVISQQGVPRLVRVLPQGGADATKAIANAFKGASVDAEILKRQVGMNTVGVPPEHQPVAEAAAHVMSSLVEAIRNTLVYFASSNPGAAAEQVVLSGGAAHLHGLGQALSSAIRLPVLLADPLATLTVSKRVDADSLRGRELELSTVVGLAMGGAE